MKLIMERQQFAEIQYLTEKCKEEISGMGTLIINKDGNFELEKLYLLEQEVSSASTDLKADAVAKAMIEASDSKGDLCFWWHSHVNMQAFFSGTDVTTIKDGGKQGYCLALVINKKGEYKLAYCQGKPFIYMDSGIELQIKDQLNPDMYSRLDKEFDLKVKTKSYGYKHNGMSLNGTWPDEYYGYPNDADYYRGYNRSNNHTPAPLIFDGKLGRYVDNPAYEEYQKEKREKRDAKKLEKEQERNRRKAKNSVNHASNVQAIREIEEEEEKAKKEFNALQEKERMEWFAKFIEFFGVNPVDTIELSLFYANHTKLLREV